MILRLQTISSFNTWIFLKHLKTYPLFKKIKCTSPLFLTLISLLRFFDRVFVEEISQFAANWSRVLVFIHFCHSCCRYKMKEKRKCWFPVHLLKYLCCTYVWYDMQKKDLLFTQIIEFSKETGCWYLYIETVCGNPT